MSTRNPLISVIMPVYNGEKFIRETLDSVLNQTYPHFEFIIVNDGSVDATGEIISSYADDRIALVNLEQNGGVSNARNTGINLSRGEFIAFCDSDDIYDADRLRIQLDFLLGHPEVGVCGSSFIFFENGEEKLIQKPVTDREIKEFLFIGNPIGQPSVMGRSKIFREFQYNAQLEASEDYDLWTRMAIAGVVFGNVPQPLVRYRAHAAQASRTKGRLLDRTFKATCTNYALAFLNNNILSEYAAGKQTSLGDFKKFIDELAMSCHKKSRDINTFLPLIALQYKKLDRFGIGAFAALKMIAAKYQIDFPAKYLLNIFLLSILPVSRESSLFDTLTKLKL